MEQEKKKNEDLTLEESFAKLEELLLVLENRETTLEESFKTYKEGMELVKSCNEKLDTVEKKMQMINEEGDYCDFPG